MRYTYRLKLILIYRNVKRAFQSTFPSHASHYLSGVLNFQSQLLFNLVHIDPSYIYIYIYTVAICYCIFTIHTYDIYSIWNLFFHFILFMFLCTSYFLHLVFLVFLLPNFGSSSNWLDDRSCTWSVHLPEALIYGVLLFAYLIIWLFETFSTYRNVRSMPPIY